MTGAEKRCAAIDVGSNTVLLLVAAIDSDLTLRELHQELRVPRLGQGLAATGSIRPDNAESALSAIGELLETARGHGAKWTRIVGTAALREAENGADFCRRVDRMFGVPVDVISGDDEARYAYLGALSNKPNLNGRNLAIDIGGGSTELIWGEGRRWRGGVSLNMGSVQLSEAFGLAAACGASHLSSAVRQIQSVLGQLDKDRPEPENLIGTAGTWTTLAAVKARMSTYDAARIDGSHLTDHELDRMIRRFRRLDAPARLVIRGMSPGREDVILGGALIARELMRWAGRSRIVISDRGVRAGVILAAFHP